MNLQVAEEYKGVVVKGVIVVVVFLVALWVFGYPILSDVLRQEKRLAELEAELERQKVFLPAYTKYTESLENEFADQLPLPKAEPVPIGSVGVVPVVVGALAQDAGLEVLDMVLDPGSLRGGSGRMMMQSITMGSLQDFRTFYLHLNAQPFVAAVERLEMQAVPGGIEVFMQLWLHVGEDGKGTAPALGRVDQPDRSSAS